MQADWYKQWIITVLLWNAARPIELENCCTKHKPYMPFNTSFSTAYLLAHMTNTYFNKMQKQQDDQQVKEYYASNDLWISHLCVTQMDRSHFILYMASLTTIYVYSCNYMQLFDLKYKYNTKPIENQWSYTLAWRDDWMEIVDRKNVWNRYKNKKIFQRKCFNWNLLIGEEKI